MRRQPPSDLTPPQVTHQLHKTVIEENRTYRLITPMFGGGAIQQQHDEVTTIRGTEIRGQLRFWWRATYGSRCKDVAEMKQQEDKIWGKANKKNEQGLKHEETVQIEITMRTTPVPIDPAKSYSYAAFPLRPERKKVGKEGIIFTLKITFPEKYKEDVKMALWAWEIFGGIGARTRRGFGALALLSIDRDLPTDDNLPPSPIQAEQWLKQKLSTVDNENLGFPYVGKDLHFRVVAGTDPMTTWESLIEKLATFRQGSDARLVRENYINGKLRTTYGRSYWPEAETVRELTGQRRSDLANLDYPQKFPRAVFGLPIIFHFIREDQHNKNNPRMPQTQKDPEDATLQANIKGSDRLASPLILKPLLCQNNQACGIAVILDGYQIPSLTLKEKNGPSHPKAVNGISRPLEYELTKEDLDKLPHLNLSNTNILEAFLDYLVGEDNQ